MKRLLSSLAQQHEMVINSHNNGPLALGEHSNNGSSTTSTTSTPREQLLGTPLAATNGAHHRASHTFQTSTTTTSSNNTLIPSSSSGGRYRSLSNSSSPQPTPQRRASRCLSPPTTSSTSPHNNISPSNNNNNTLHAQLYSLQQQQKNEALYLKHIQVAKLYKFNFEDLYDCLEIRVLFKQFLIKNQNEENYYFDQILDSEYKKLKSNRNRYHMAKRMIETFVKAGAPYELNLSEKIKQSVLREFQKATPENCPLDMFDSVQYQVLTSMRLDAYPRFIQSDEFLSFIGGKISSFKNLQQKLRFIKSIGAVKKVAPLEKSSSKGNLRKSINAKQKKSEEETVKESLMMDQIDTEDNTPENLVLPVEEILGGFEAIPFMAPTPTSMTTTTTCQSSNPTSTTSPQVSTVTTHSVSSTDISEPSSIKRSMSSIVGHLFNKSSPNNSNSSTSSIQPYIHTTRTRNASGSVCDLNFHESSSGASNHKSAIAIRLHDSLPRAIAPINNFIVTPCSDDEKDDDEDEDDEESEEEHESTPTEHERVKNFDKIMHKSSLFEKSLSSERPFHESTSNEALEPNDHHLWDEVDTCLSDETSEEDEDDDENEDELEEEMIGGNLAAAAKQITVSTSAVANNTVIPLLETLSAFMEKLQLTVDEIEIMKTEYQNYMNNYSSLELNTILKQVDSSPKKDNDWTMIQLQPKTRKRSILNRNQANKTLDVVSQYNLKAHFARFDSPVSDDVTYMLRRSCKLPYNAFSVLQLLCDESSYETMVNPLLLAPAEYIEFVVKDTDNSYASLISLEGAKWPWPLKQRHYVTTGTVISDILNDEKENPNRKRYIILKRSVVNNAKVEITLNKKENPNRVIGVKLEAYFVESSIANECTLTMFNEWRFTNVNKWTFPSKLFKKSLKLFTNDFHHALIDKLSSATILHATSYGDFISNSEAQEHSPSTKKDNTLLHTLFRNDALPKKDEIKSKVKNIFHTLSLMKLFEYDLNETCRVIEERQHVVDHNTTRQQQQPSE